MADIEKVIKGIEHCTNMEYGKGNNSCAGCPYLISRGGFNQFRCGSQDLLKDALELLKELKETNDKLTMAFLTLPDWNPVIVRCKDCVYGMMFKNVKDEQRFECVSPTHNGTYVEAHDPDWFCADGRKKDDKG